MKVAAIFVALVLSLSVVEGGQRHVASPAVVRQLQTLSNYATVNGRNTLKWETGGVALRQAETNPTHWVEPFAVGGGVNGTIAMDGGRNECVAFCRLATNAPGSGSWQKGPPAVFSTGVRNQMTIGTVLANFNSSGIYQGHCVVFAGWTPNGMSVWHQNVGTRAITWSVIPVSGQGGYNDAQTYFVVETN
ncbi:MAG: hypothetical protein ACKO2P_21215 [Planctomycetota bacterium]